MISSTGLIISLLLIGLSHLVAVSVGVYLGHLATTGKMVRSRKFIPIQPYKGIQNRQVAEDILQATQNVTPTAYGPVGNLSEEEVKYARRAMETGAGEGFQI